MSQDITYCDNKRCTIKRACKRHIVDKDVPATGVLMTHFWQRKNKSCQWFIKKEV